MQGLNASTLRPKCPLWVKSRHSQCKGTCPLCPRKRTLGVGSSMSARVPTADIALSFEDLVGAPNQRVGDGDAQRLGSL